MRIVGDYVYLAMGVRGLIVFEILPTKKLRQVTFNSQIDCVDIAYDITSRTLYLLDRNVGV